MKEAAGEANMTVITIVLIGIVLGVGTVIVTNLMDNVVNQSNVVTEASCRTAGGTWDGKRCIMNGDSDEFSGCGYSLDNCQAQGYRKVDSYGCCYDSMIASP